MPGRLLLVPTAMERDRLLAESAALGGFPGVKIELCGFGVIAAATLTTHWLHVHRPDQVVLAGIAGSLDDRLSVGSATWFSRVACHGIGVGGRNSSDFVSASELGWNQIASEAFDGPVGDSLSLHVFRDYRATLLTVCAASVDRETADERKLKFDLKIPDDVPVLAEDMEGFAVAMACQVAGVPLSIVRGISNRAGNRKHGSWDLDGSLCSVTAELATFFSV